MPIATIGWDVYDEGNCEHLYCSELPSATWTHLVFTVSGTTMKVFKNGILVGTKIDGHEPNVVTRTQHTIGAFNKTNGLSTYCLDGTVAHLRFWNDRELSAEIVSNLYSVRDTSFNQN
ncbi:hypothetical protein TrLO_g14047 [Triparma laevis f. longispina]|uniref:LamG domain-containing protein n=1 Tax=Triparma laevis f. longispina TaxID=1714387 RepID=A0A9W7FP28_9STRA|nr:hypothetical protein TrLO_g14047 [Triparma laevis f. longispina]